MKLLLVIGTGSFIGGVLRFLISQFIQTKTSLTFPFGTLGVNIAGCLLIGVVYGLVAQSRITDEWRLFLATGILGGFTTFSAFSYESVMLLREGQLVYSFAYIASSVLLGLAATFVGLQLVK